MWHRPSSEIRLNPTPFDSLFSILYLCLTLCCESVSIQFLDVSFSSKSRIQWEEGSILLFAARMVKTQFCLCSKSSSNRNFFQIVYLHLFSVAIRNFSFLCFLPILHHLHGIVAIFD